ncbi:hypothetical protein GFL54_35220 [Rhizobium laguerreae]|nr:hypothetical protein [Rhizobium laguerreae]NKN09899.1 hypothetical protein [Rhizobium laguerreae]
MASPRRDLSSPSSLRRFEHPISRSNSLSITTPFGVVLYVRVHRRNIPFDRDNVAKLMRELL